MTKEMHMRDDLHCPCHDGRFNLVTGQVLAGPPPSPLPKLRISVVGDDLFAMGWEEPAYVASLPTYP